MRSAKQSHAYSKAVQSECREEGKEEAVKLIQPRPGLAANRRSQDGDGASGAATCPPAPELATEQPLGAAELATNLRDWGVGPSTSPAWIYG